MSKVLKGIAASDGIATAEAYMLVEPDLSFDKKTNENPDEEIQRLHSAIDVSKKELETIKEKAKENLGEEEAEVFEAHLTILSDPEMIGQIETKINDEKVNAESALKDVTDTFISMFEAMTDNAYMQERAGDIRDVTKRVLSHLLGVTLPSPALIDKEVIIVAHDLTPSDTAQLDRRYVKGFVTDIGGRTSHSAIMSRTLEIPAVVGSESATEDIHEGDQVIIDGIHGEAIVKPSADEVHEYEQMAKDFAAQKAEWEQLKNEKSVTADGKEVILAANIGTPQDVEGANDNGAEAVGLFRSEFLYMDASELPSEDDQFEAYKEALEGMNGKQVVVRTMDIGGDKKLPYLPLPDEQNPFLGYRAIRLCLDQQEIFRTQLRALLRASKYGKLAIMFPMIATVQEFKDAKAIFEEALTQAHKARLEILDNMLACIGEPRKELSPYAPKIAMMNIDPDKIKDVIGPGGKMINQIIAECDNVKIDIDDDGKVVIYHHDYEVINKAKEMIEGIVKEAHVGEVYAAKVVRIEKFGAFVNLFGSTDGLLHISKISHNRVDKVEDVLKIGDIIDVKVMEIDNKGRINVSAKALLPKPKKAETPAEE